MVGLKAPVFKKKSEKTGEIKNQIRNAKKQNKTVHERQFEKQLMADIKKSVGNKRSKLNKKQS